MIRGPLPAAKRAEVVEAYRRLGTYSAVQGETGVYWRHVKRIVKQENARDSTIATALRPVLASPLTWGHSPEEGLPPIVQEVLRERGRAIEARVEPDPAPRDMSHKEDDESATVEYTSDRRIRTLEDALEYAEVDLKVWRVDRWEAVAWESSMKLRAFDQGKVVGETPVRRNLWRVKLYLKRVLPKSLQAATDAIFETMREYSPKYPPLPPRKTPARPHMCVVDLFDVHFGKLAWSAETNGDSYDLKHAENLYRNAVIDILAEASGRVVEQFVFPLGNDFLHIDNNQNTTTNGTPQDTDGRFAKIIETGERAVIWAIEQLAAVAPVHVYYVPGNHDRLVALLLTRTVAAWFRHCGHVTVDLAPTTRKAHRYGSTLLAFTHGDEEPVAALSGIMANEWKEDFCQTTTHEWHRGHRHRPKKYEMVPVNSQDGVVIRDLRSLSSVDAWHYRRGYIGGSRAAEAYFYEKTGGFVCQYVAKARLDA